MTPSPVTMSASVAMYPPPAVDKNNGPNNNMMMTPYNTMNHHRNNAAAATAVASMEATPPHQFYAPNTKGLLNAPGQNNCFLNSAVQVKYNISATFSCVPFVWKDAWNSHGVSSPTLDSNRINCERASESDQKKFVFLT